MQNKELKQFILQLSAEAGEFLRNHFYTFKNIVDTQRGRHETNVDVELGEIIKRRIHQQYPDHAILLPGQADENGSDFVWLVEPLDGRQHFLRSIPIYTVNIALQYKGETIFGAINSPQTRQLFFAAKGDGAQLNGIDINVSDKKELSDSFIFVELPEQSNSPEYIDQQMKNLSELVKQVEQVETYRIGALGQCLVAAGSFDGYVDLSGTSQALSQLASNLIIKEAGGEIIDLSNGKKDIVQFITANQQLTPKLKNIFL